MNERNQTVDRSPEAILNRHYEYLKDSVQSTLDEMLLMMDKHPERITGKMGWRIGMTFKAHKQSLERLEDEIKAAKILI